MNKGFTSGDLAILQKYKLSLPSNVLMETLKDGDTGSKGLDKTGEINKELGRAKGHLSTTKTAQEKNKDEIAAYTGEIDVTQKYRRRIGVIKEGQKTLTIGKGIYTQTKRNAYKINPESSTYGNLTIDVPKLYGQLRLVAYKNNEKVYDKQVDFDTLDLRTKRFNSRKKYSPLSKMVFGDLNRISEIPIHRTSNKYNKIGSGVVYYNNPDDLMSRLKLLGGTIMAITPWDTVIFQ